jgi:hypothetical protein
VTVEKLETILNDFPVDGVQPVPGRIENSNGNPQSPGTFGDVFENNFREMRKTPAQIRLNQLHGMRYNQQRLFDRFN